MPALPPRYQARLALLPVVLWAGLRQGLRPRVQRSPLHGSLPESQMRPEEVDGLHALLPLVSHQGAAEVEDRRKPRQLREMWLGCAARVLVALSVVCSEAVVLLRNDVLRKKTPASRSSPAIFPF